MEAVWSDLSFKNSPSIPERCSHTATVIGEDIYIIGGGICVNQSAEWRQYGDIWKVSPEMKDIQKIQPANGDITPRRGHSALNYQNRWIVVFGGFIQAARTVTQGSDEDPDLDPYHSYQPPVLSNDLQIFDLKALKWLSVTQRGAIPYSRRGHIAAIHQNKMIVFGGDSDRLGHARSISELDLTPLSEENGEEVLLDSVLQLTWRYVPYSGDVIPPLLSLAAYSLSKTRSQIFIYGGTCLDYFTMAMIPSKRLFYFDLCDYSFHDLFLVCKPNQGDPSSDCSDHLMSLPEPRFCATMTHLNDDCFIIYGGTTQEHQYFSTIYLFRVIPFDQTATLTSSSQ
jgi:hypothetical protein